MKCLKNCLCKFPENYYEKLKITLIDFHSFFRLTQKIHRKLPTTEETSSFPRLPGTQSKTINPALEFIKSVCKVLSLDSSISEEVSKLKRNMLKLINIGEFSDAAVWHDPCITVILPEVICKVCNHCRDIDLCKDEHRIEKDGK